MDDEREPEPRPAGRRIDMTSLKGLAHPLRVQILDALSVYGPQTASGLAERLGESSGSTSYHLRQLARHDFVREIPGRGSGRDRWWERPPGGIELDSRALPDTAAARAASDLVEWEWERQRQALFHDFIRRRDQELPKEWVDSNMVSTMNAQLTAEQLREVVDEIEGVMQRFLERHRDQRNNPVPGSRPVQFQFNAFPVMDGVEEPKESE
ncbi:ArsR/SmtB family transcription factor [Herbiconiux daphne]|uniref:Helix-turn-helix domain-containing protein n=1 Tax=Herbiconiux daphne TaxID=2970914 RepID=A0ABT2H5W0_9MICO|nr:helix-turn-helix domain-containing protein [Herbiconiux daphne]MCS5735312.1 helix-turn-helix domain-containing protein [Herbiconiux daphne]